MSSVLALGAFSLLALVLALPAAAYAAWVRRYDRRDALRKWRQSMRFFVLVGWTFGALALAAVDVGVDAREAVATAAGVSAPHVVPRLAEATALVGGGFAVAVVVYAASAAPAGAYRDLDHGLGRAVVRASTTLAAVGCLVVLPVTVFLVPSLGTATLVASFALLYVAWVVGWPAMLERLHAIRVPTPAERERLEPAFEAADFDPHATLVADLVPEEELTAQIVGPVWCRRFVVSNYVLATIDDEALRAVVALNAGAHRVRTTERALATTVGTLGVLALGIALVPWPWVVGVFAAVVVAFFVVRWWYTRRLVFRMDEVAAELVGPETVLAAFRWRIETHDASLEPSRVRTFLTGVPARRDRMARLLDDRDVEAFLADATADGNATPAATAGDGADTSTTGDDPGPETDPGPEAVPGLDPSRDDEEPTSDARGGTASDVAAWGVPTSGAGQGDGDEVRSDESDPAD